MIPTNAFPHHVADREKDPNIIAAMARVTKSAQEESEKSQRETETSKNEYNSGTRDLGPNVRVLVQKIEEVRGDVAPIKKIPSKEETVSIVKEATDTISNKIDSLSDRTVADIKSMLDTQANRFRTTVTKQELDKGLVELRTSLTRDFGHELLNTKEEILSRHEAGEFATESLAFGKLAQSSLNKIDKVLNQQYSHVQAMAANIESLKDTADKDRTESDGTWNTLFCGLDKGFSKLATRQDVQEVGSTIAIRVDSLPRVDSVQMERIEAAASTLAENVVSKFDRLMETLQEQPTRQEYGGMLRYATNLSRDSIVREIQSAITFGHQKAMEDTEKALDTLRCMLSRENQEGLEALGTTAITATTAVYERTELLRKDNEQAMASLRSEYEAKLLSKDAEIKLLRESMGDLRKVCADNKTTIQRLEIANSTNVKELQNAAVSRERLESNFRDQVQKERDLSTQLNNELEKRAIIINAKNDLLVQSQREAKEEVMRNTEMVAEAKVLKMRCEGLQANVDKLTQSKSQLLGRIDILRRYHTSPDGPETNEISGLFYELGAQLRDLKMDDVACIEGEEFLVHLASELVRVGSAQRLRHFVSRVQDNKPRCFSQVCGYGNAESLERRLCEQHGSQCVKMCVRTETSGDERLIYFPL